MNEPNGIHNGGWLPWISRRDKRELEFHRQEADRLIARTETLPFEKDTDGFWLPASDVDTVIDALNLAVNNAPEESWQVAPADLRDRLLPARQKSDRGDIS